MFALPQLANAKTRIAAHAVLIAASIPLLLPASGCSASSPYVSTVGALKAGTTLHVAVGNAVVSAYAPEARQPRNLFTIAATALPHGTPPPPPMIRPVTNGITVTALQPLASLLVRVPDGSNLVVRSQRGDISVTDIAGNADVATGNGNVTVMLNGYAQAATEAGALTVTMGAQSWPGTLRFFTKRGDITLWINPRANCAVRLHTGDGTLFTDFGLRGVSSGVAETIDGVIGAGGSQRLDVEAATGSIRLMRLQPQA